MRSANLIRGASRGSLILSLLAGLLLGGCMEGGSTTANPQTQAPSQGGYSGPAARTDDAQAFRLHLWEPLRATNRCGACHSVGGQSPQFVRDDDVNLAYSAANPLVDLSATVDSRLVSKIGAGHNCWLDCDAACAAVITAYLDAWADSTGIGDGRQIELKAPPLKTVGDSRILPDDPTLFGATLYPLLTSHCAECHWEDAATAQAPFFAGPDLAAAYAAVAAKVDLDLPQQSRLVVRLRDEFHNCWSGDCQSDAAELRSQIEAIAAQVVPTPVDPALVLSKALQLGDGVIASGGSRYESNQIALYEFKIGEGTTVYDTSGVEPALNLTLSGDVSWVSGWGLNFAGGKVQGPTSASRKLIELIQATGEYSIEAWVVPANVTQEGLARIVSYSGGVDTRNFTLGQTRYNYDFLQRTEQTGADGEPGLSTADADERLQAAEQHIVVSCDPLNGRRIYVNGQFTGDIDPLPGGSLIDWDDSFALVLGNEVSGDRPWLGKLRLLAIHNRALTPEQIARNQAAGVGEKFFLLFSVSELVGLAQSYILFEVSQFDSYSYLFNQPRFISLDATVQPSNTPLAGMRIGINGHEAVVGQVYSNLDLRLGGFAYSPEQGQLLSPLGTIIASERGVAGDEFFLSFERLGSHSHVFTEPMPLAPPPPADGEPQPVIGLRTFDEINASMAELTGVSPSQSEVRATFDSVKQQLPAVEKIGGFLSAHQVAVSQLAIEYCNALVEDQALRSSYFPGFPFDSEPRSAFAGGRALMLDPLLSRMLGGDLADQPAEAEARAELNQLTDRLTACGASCEAGRTATVVKANCAALLGSAVMLLQ
ncbi:Concanavalin A-like lectin/glucanases superfamily [endosymbiont of Ridgeia piscesae]|uniref:Concanavalin A-like lectin/glucanases superfamily n=3 Tax=endosymbiont of Ridgeia piscesae TaxID=54398 RepID=A0A0T5YVK4_9GAMM|nr:LamG domain-containing protein [endosymbiont of Ridgeia piscesae]KRT54543.1 Concanavalin A-like lectin/glucanases superfamily [endosymbiont of Ridgeia piscesae]